MNFFSGIIYHFKGLRLALKSLRLFLLGLSRLILIVLLVVLLTGLVLYYHSDILNVLWARPESGWLIWLWHLVSWILTLILIGVSSVFSYLIAQILFSAIIMDFMSRITEAMMTGQVKEPQKMPFWRLFFYLIRQEIPRAILPILISLALMILGWLTPFGPVLVIISSGLAIIFLAWDNTDLIPARQLVPFRKRWKQLAKSIPFHVGFGLPFLIPLINIVFLSFAPVGATLYWLDREDL